MPLLMGYYRLFMADCKHFKFSRKKYSNLTNPNLLKNITLIQRALTTGVCQESCRLDSKN